MPRDATASLLPALEKVITGNEAISVQSLSEDHSTKVFLRTYSRSAGAGCSLGVLFGKFKRSLAGEYKRMRN